MSVHAGDPPESEDAEDELTIYFEDEEEQDDEELTIIAEEELAPKNS